MKYDFLILGVGMQGKIAARDLLEHDNSVFLADLYKENASKILKYPKTEFAIIDLSNIKETIELIKKVDPRVVLNCAEGDWNLNVYKACLQTKKHVLDLGSDIPMTKKQFAMHKDFKKNDIVAITGCGSTPGINNIMLHHAHQLFDSVETIEVGFAWDSNIKKFVVPFSIQSIIEEFTDPAPLIENGKLIEVNPLDRIEERNFREIGKQKCFLVRHPETYTFNLFNKKLGLKNLRYYAGFPSHSADTIRTFIDSGLGNKTPIIIDGKKIVPVDVLTQVLKKLPFPDGYTEKENIWVHVWGKKNKKHHEILMECIVNTLPGWEDAGCNVDTGMPASIMAIMVKNGTVTARGSFAPGPVIPVDLFFKELRERSMTVYQNGTVIN
ncbi:MAG: saccharopine dehydrogenase C-terminal domain-containing protein [bacterium]|nr:saccharopine dehydrogenase C-terminal domain-containing protein [bacterium]